MTVQNIIENIQVTFPNVGTTQILKEIDKAQKYYAHIGRLLKESTDLSDISTLSTTVEYTLPSDFDVLIGVDLYDSNGKPIYDSLNMAYTLNKDESKLVFYSTLENTVLSGLNASVGEAVLKYYKIPATIDERSDNLEIPEILHEGIEARVYEKFYAKIPTFRTDNGVSIDWNMLRYWRGIAENYKIEAIRYGNKSKRKSYNVINYPYAGSISRPRKKES